MELEQEPRGTDFWGEEGGGEQACCEGCENGLGCAGTNEAATGPIGDEVAEARADLFDGMYGENMLGYVSSKEEGLYDILRKQCRPTCQCRNFSPAEQMMFGLPPRVCGWVTKVGCPPEFSQPPPGATCPAGAPAPSPPTKAGPSGPDPSDKPRPGLPRR